MHIGVTNSGTRSDTAAHMPRPTALSARAETIEEVPASTILKGDHVLVNAGDRIPVDGIVYWGNGAADESIVTGESTPRDKVAGSATESERRVIGGSTLVSGSIKVHADTVGSESVLARIIGMVRQAQNNPPEIQRLGDRVSAVFVPLIGMAAILAHRRHVECDRSAVRGGVAPRHRGAGNRLSVRDGSRDYQPQSWSAWALPCDAVSWFRDGRSLDTVAGVSRMVFDKTGTLTSGELRPQRVQALNGSSDEHVLALLIGLERHSSHPLARAMVAAYPEVAAMSFPEISERNGVGISGRASTGKTIQVGSHALVKHLDVSPATTCTCSKMED